MRYLLTGITGFLGPHLAKQLIKKLRKDEEFYLYCSNIAKEKYKNYYNEQLFKKNIYLNKES